MNSFWIDLLPFTKSSPLTQDLLWLTPLLLCCGDQHGGSTLQKPKIRKGSRFHQGPTTFPHVTLFPKKEAIPILGALTLERRSSAQKSSACCALLERQEVKYKAYAASLLALSLFHMACMAAFPAPLVFLSAFPIGQAICSWWISFSCLVVASS